LQKQTIKPTEIIVVDNNSTDNTKTIAKKYGAKVFTETNQGHVFALSTGMNHAMGDIIAVTDADTVHEATWLETICQKLEPQDVVCVTGSALVKTGNKLTDSALTGFYGVFMAGNTAVGKPHVNGFCFAVKKEPFKKAGGIDLRYRISSDVDLGIRLSKFGKVLYVPELSVVTSTRRWNKHPHKVFLKYARAYVYAVWLRKPPPFQLNVIR
jgi:glycosyltransferase involved in cell wall biosynthesis